MKILIYTHGRSGSTNLLATLCTLYQYFGIPEPFNEELYELWGKESPLKKSDPIPENCVVKNIVFQADGWVQTSAKDFDKVIFLFRDNFRDAVISGRNAVEYGYDQKYKPTYGVETKQTRIVSTLYNRLAKQLDFFSEIEQLDNIHVMWYNDIYSGDYEKTFDVIKTLKDDLTKEEFDVVWERFLNPEHRLKQEI